MNLAPIPEIKSQLKAMYPDFHFDMKANEQTRMYEITAFKGRKKLDVIQVADNMPITEFWAGIKAWMMPLLRK